MAKRDPHRRAPSKEQFPAKLYTMLNMADLGSFVGASWLPHDRAFRITNEEQFMTSVPMFFKATKTRFLLSPTELRLSRGKDQGAWYNESFMRGRPEEMKNMVRVKIKGTGNCQRCGMEEDPDFYAIPPLLPVGPQPQVTGSGPSVSRPPVISSSSDPRRVSLELPFLSAEESRFPQGRRSSYCQQREAFEPPMPQCMPSSIPPKPDLSATVSLSSQVSQCAASSLPYSAADSTMTSPVSSPINLPVQRRSNGDNVDKPLPYDEGPAYDCIPTFPTLRALDPVTVPEPQPFHGRDALQYEERDDFANYIDSVIHLVN
ncbi:hypothetical protein ACHAWF_008393 [Thalassiosira exigua]